jgi:fumarate reductase flavoprotein subunit
LNSELARLLKDESGAVTGAVLKRDGQNVSVESSAVILATGGYSANKDLFPELSAGKPLYGGGYPYSQGAGLKAAVEAGAEIINKDKFLPTFAGVDDPNAPGGVTLVTQTYPQFRQPWEVYVGREGQRFVREDEPSVDTRERALLSLPGMEFWVIYDAAIKQAAPSLFAKITPEVAEARFGVHPSYQRADTLAELARMIEIDPPALVATIDAYNTGIAQGSADPMGRQHRPLPIAQGPFYAIRHVGWSIVGFAGLAVDDTLRVLDQNRQPIPNLYAAGEILGLGATSGNAFVGGMSVTPAMTFGRLLGQRLGMQAKAMLAAE